MRYLESALMLFVLLPFAVTQTQPSSSPLPQDKFVGVWLYNNQKTEELNLHNGLHLYPTYLVESIRREGMDLVISTKRGPLPPFPDGSSPFGMQERRELQWSYRCDGEVHSIPYGTVSCRVTDLGVIEGCSTYEPYRGMLDSHKLTCWRREVSADGAEMRRYWYKDIRMSTIDSTQVYDRCETKNASAQSSANKNAPVSGCVVVEH